MEILLELCFDPTTTTTLTGTAVGWSVTSEVTYFEPGRARNAEQTNESNGSFCGTSKCEILGNKS
jgi:hypothetical protein